MSLLILFFFKCLYSFSAFPSVNFLFLADLVKEGVYIARFIAGNLNMLLERNKS